LYFKCTFRNSECEHEKVINVTEPMNSIDTPHTEFFAFLIKKFFLVRNLNFVEHSISESNE
jgi:hypothetical protein